MRLGLTRRGDYPEPIARELDQLVTAIQAGHSVEHDADGVQRRTYGRWQLGANQSLANGTATRVTVTLAQPGTDTGADLRSEGGGIIRLRRAGVYLIVAQVRFASDTVGARLVEVEHNAVTVARVSETPVGVHRTQCVALVLAAANDTVAMTAYQSSGGALNAEAASGETALVIARVA